MERKPRRAPPDRSTQLHFSPVIERHAQDRGGAAALARAIAEANHMDPAEPPIDRRKLTRIAEGRQDLVFSMAELIALDRYLEPFGEGLAYKPLFRRANVLQTIAAAGRPVTFLVGSRPVGETDLSLDHWDVNALTEIQRGVGNFAPEVRFDIRDVLLHEDLGDARSSLSTGRWTRLLDAEGPSLVCLGSGRATHAAELLLSRMFDLPALEDSPDRKKQLPFHFAWPPGIRHDFPSAFRYTTDELEAIDPAKARIVREGRASALVMGDEIHLDRLRQRGQSGESYGVCVAQRRASGQVWLVLAGVTGPATYAAARLAAGLGLDLVPLEPRQPSPVYWAAVRADVKRDRTRRFGNVLAVEDQHVLSGPHPF